MYDVVIVGCGLAGMVAARELADLKKRVLIIEKRNHIGGNIYDYIDEDGFLVQKYGPHCFFTDEYSVKEYVERFVETEDCFVKCRTMINGMKIPMPFNFESIDIIYNLTDAAELKKRLLSAFLGREIVSVTELLNSSDDMIKAYGQFMFENEYKLYTAKQWGLDIADISPEVFQRVPVYLSYFDVYQKSKYQFLAKGGFTNLAQEILKHDLIDVELGIDALDAGIVSVDEQCIVVQWNGIVYNDVPVLFTGEIDRLFKYENSRLPYRSLEFVWKYLDEDEYQETEIVAYPQADKITRVTEYKKLPVQEHIGTKIALEIPVQYSAESPVGNEPYYPIKNETNNNAYNKYFEMSKKINNLFLCGRLAEYKYYNMDSVILNSLKISKDIIRYLD